MGQPGCHRDPVFIEFGCCELRSSSCQELPRAGEVPVDFAASCCRKGPAGNALGCPGCHQNISSQADPPLPWDARFRKTTPTSGVSIS